MSRRVSDKSVHARVHGREALALKTVWYVEFGPLRFRCVLMNVNAQGIHRYQLQHRQDGIWNKLYDGNNPQLLLRRLVASNVVGLAIDDKAKAAAELFATEPAEAEPG